MANYTATIGGAPVNVLAGTLNVQNQIGQRSQGELRVWSALGVTWQYGTQVQVFDDTAALVYSGYVSKDKASKPGGARLTTGYLEHDIRLMDNCYRADKRRVFKSYLGVTAGFIVNDLLASYLAAEGVTGTSSSIAAGPLITEVIWPGAKSVADALTWLATQSGYWWQIDVHGVLWFQPYSGMAAPFAIDGTQVDALQDLSVEYGNDMYVNKQYAKGAYAATGVQVETYHGDGVRRNWTASYEIADLSGVDRATGTRLGVTLNGAWQTLGAKGVDNGLPFYWAAGDAVLAQDPSQPLLTSGDTLIITYKGRYPVLASAQNPALIAAQQAREGGGTGLVESIYRDTKVRTLSAAFQIASALLGHYGQDTTLLTFSTLQKGLAPGQMLSVSLADFGLTNRQMLISSVTITDAVDGVNIWYQVQAVGSPIETAQWQTYWQNLMSQSSDPSDFTDVADTALAFLSSTTLVRTPTVTITQAKAICPICGNATFCNTTTIIC
jgi:hypothetical protein